MRPSRLAQVLRLEQLWGLVAHTSALDLLCLYSSANLENGEEVKIPSKAFVWSIQLSILGERGVPSQTLKYSMRGETCKEMDSLLLFRPLI